MLQSKMNDVNPDTRDAEYTRRLSSLEGAAWKRWLNVQAPYRWNLRRLQLGFTLDIGCGIGRNLVNLGGHGVGVDHNERSVELARERGCDSVAVPAVGAGVGGLSLQRCAEISIEEARRHLEGDDSLDEIRFVLYGEPAYRVFEMVHDAARVQAQMERLRRR